MGRKDVWPPDVRKLADRAPKRDTEAANGSSIAVLAEHDGQALLLAGDALAPVLIDSIDRLLEKRKKRRLKIDAFKLPHHGSRKNLCNELLSRLECPSYLISTSGKRFAHPDHEALCRVIVHGGDNPELVFNYRSDSTKDWEGARLRDAPPFSTRYLAPGEVAVP